MIVIKIEKILLLRPLSNCLGPSGGNGRRAWLRAMFSQGSASSILVLGTKGNWSVGLLK